MLTKIHKVRFCGLMIVFSMTILSSIVRAQPLHSIMLNVPNYPEEALIWCGPAVGQMIMNGYPSGKCFVLQEDIWAAIQSHKVETQWDTDPEGLKEALKKLCPPTRTWVIDWNADSKRLMYWVAYYMTKFKYPVAALLNTLPNSSYPSHAEHWVVIKGIITDKNPVTNPTVDLKFVWIDDPVVPMGDPSIEILKAGSQWYNEFKAVTKTGSKYSGAYVAIIEPPSARGMTTAPVEILRGGLIPPEEALRFALRWIKEFRLDEMETYKMLKEARPLAPLLVNKDFGGYYIVPFAAGGETRQTQIALIINAYKGNLQEVGVFRPVTYMPKEEAISIALKYLKLERAGRIEAELYFPTKEYLVSRYFPLWKIIVDNKILHIDRQGKVFKNIL